METGAPSGPHPSEQEGASPGQGHDASGSRGPRGAGFRIQAPEGRGHGEAQAEAAPEGERQGAVPEAGIAAAHRDLGEAGGETDAHEEEGRDPDGGESGPRSGVLGTRSRVDQVPAEKVEGRAQGTGEGEVQDEPRRPRAVEPGRHVGQAREHPREAEDGEPGHAS